eukprot:gene533-9395_t
MHAPGALRPRAPWPSWCRSTECVAFGTCGLSNKRLREPWSGRPFPLRDVVNCTDDERSVRAWDQRPGPELDGWLRAAHPDACPGDGAPSAQAPTCLKGVWSNVGHWWHDFLLPLFAAGDGADDLVGNPDAVVEAVIGQGTGAWGRPHAAFFGRMARRSAAGRGGATCCPLPRQQKCPLPRQGPLDLVTLAAFLPTGAAVMEIVDRQTRRDMVQASAAAAAAGLHYLRWEAPRAAVVVVALPCDPLMMTSSRSSLKGGACIAGQMPRKGRWRCPKHAPSLVYLPEPAASLCGPDGVGGYGQEVSRLHSQKWREWEVVKEKEESRMEQLEKDEWKRDQWAKDERERGRLQKAEWARELREKWGFELQ